MLLLVPLLLPLLSATADGQPSSPGSPYLDAASLQAARNRTVTEVPPGALPRYLPRIPEAEQIRKILHDLGFSTGVEMIVHAELPGIDLVSEEGRLALYRQLQAVSTLRGITYYSATRGRDRALFREAYVVSSPDDPDARPDPAPVSIPPWERLHVFLRDTTFGRGVYTVEYTNTPDYHVVRITNTERLKYLLLPVVAAEGMQMFFVLLPGHEEAVIYGLGGAVLTRLPALAKLATTSFNNRVKAIHEWLRSQLSQEPR